MLAMLVAMAAAGQPISYTEKSGLFAAPAWEIGRTVLTIADVNLDGHPDLLSIGDHGSPFFGGSQIGGIAVWLGDGKGNFSHAQTGSFGYGGIAVGDVNNDGLPDVAYGMHHNWSATDFGDQVLEVALGDGSGMSWTPWDDNLGLQGQWWGMFGCALADFDNDGWLDLASNAFGCCDGIHAYLNNRDGTWTPVMTRLEGNSDMDIQGADFNNDGFMDIATSHQHGSTWMGDGKGGFTIGDAGLPGSGGLLGRVGVSAGDIDGDGFDDLAFCPGNGGLHVWRRTPGGWVKASDGLPAAPNAPVYSRTLLADMDHDGHRDLVAFRSQHVEVYRGDGAGAWSPAAVLSVPAPGSFAAMAVGDVDHNGRPEIFVVAREQVSAFTSRNKLRMWMETTPVTKPSLRVSSPSAGRVWRAGTAVVVEWEAAGTRPVDLWLSHAGASGPWRLIASDLPPSGRHQMRVMPTWAGSGVYLRASLGGPEGTQDVAGPLAIMAGSCVADCDGSGVLDVFDLLCFQGAYSEGWPYADCDGSGGLSVFDFLCYQDLYATGCP